MFWLTSALPPAAARSASVNRQDVALIGASDTGHKVVVVGDVERVEALARLADICPDRHTLELGRYGRVDDAKVVQRQPDEQRGAGERGGSV